MACSCPLNASPWLIAEKSQRIKTLPETLGHGVTLISSKRPTLTAYLSGPWATKAIFSSTFIFLCSLTCISLSFCVCLCIFVHTRRVSLSPPPHIPSSPFVFAVFHFLFLYFLFSQETPTFRMKKHQWPQLLFYCDHSFLVSMFFFFLLCAHTHNSYFW